MSVSVAWWVIGGMALSNFAVRYLPIALVSRLRLPAPVIRWLSFIPVSVMAALVAVEVLRPGGTWLAAWDNPFPLAALPTGLVYHRTHSFLGATLVGVLAFLLIRHLLGLV